MTKPLSDFKIIVLLLSMVAVLTFGILEVAVQTLTTGNGFYETH